MVKAGFDEFAHLRLRDHRPGNGDYELPPVFGPHSDSSKRSILHKYTELHQEHSAAVGPGSYTIPSYIGKGRSTTFSFTSHNDLNTSNITHETENNIMPTAEDYDNAKRKTNQVCKNFSAIPQYNMALCPDTPYVTIHNKLPLQWIVNPTGALGPGAYNVNESYDKLYSTTPGVTFGARWNSLENHTNNKESTPGPGAYVLRRFGDVDHENEEGNNTTTTTNNNNTNNTPSWSNKRAVAPVVSLHRLRHESHLVPSERTPGPGCYGDPTTIAHRICRPKISLTNVSTFGTRDLGSINNNNNNSNSTNNTLYRRIPGPGAYHPERGYKLIERSSGHAPRFRAPPREYTLITSTKVKKLLEQEQEEHLERQQEPLMQQVHVKSKILNKTHPDHHKFQESDRNSVTTTLKSNRKREKAGYEINLPSDFDYSCTKGKSMSSRWRTSATHAANTNNNNNSSSSNNTLVGPGSYNTGNDHVLSKRRAIRACQFAAEPYDKDKVHTLETNMIHPLDGNTSATEYYNTNYELIEPRAPCALVMNGREHVLDSTKEGLPGPGHYNPEYKVIDTQCNRATEFYKGDFSNHGSVISNAGAVNSFADERQIGPGSYYNDQTMYSNSIAGNLASSAQSRQKACTFGIRYPARALYQVCKPRDKSTNINVTYDDERS